MIYEVLEAVAYAVVFLIGFGAGRIKNAAKLKAIQAVIDQADASVKAEAKQAVSSVTAEIRKHV